MAGIHWSDDASAKLPSVTDRGSITIEQSAFRQYGGVVFGFTGGIAFLVGGLAFASQAPIALIGFWFFAILMILGGVVYLRRGSDRRLIEVGPGGIWLPEMGRLAWAEIREVRLEALRGVGDGDRVVLRRRVGVEPADPELSPSGSMRLAWGLFDGYSRFIKSMAPGMRFGSQDRAPFGFGEPEGTPAQVDAVLAVIGQYVGIIDADEERARRNAPRWAGQWEGGDRAGVPLDLGAIDARLAPTAGQGPVSASVVPIEPQRPPAAVFRFPAFGWQMVWGWILGLIPVSFVAVLFVGMLAQLHAFSVLVLVALGLLVGLPILLRVGRQRLDALRRGLGSATERTVLRVGPDGLWLGGMGLVDWQRIRAIRTRVSGRTRVGLTGEIPRWGLFVEADPAGVPHGEWAAYADELDAPFDDVVDLVRYYHPVEEAGEAAGPGAAAAGKPTARSEAVTGLIGAAMFAMAVGFIALTVFGWSKTTALAERGVTAPGSVTAKVVTNDDGPHYRLRYAFTSVDGSRHAGEGSVSAGAFSGTAVGDTVAVTYLAEDPGTNVLGRATAPPAILFVGPLGLEVVFVIVGGWMALGTLRGWRKRRS